MADIFAKAFVKNGLEKIKNNIINKLDRPLKNIESINTKVENKNPVKELDKPLKNTQQKEAGNPNRPIEKENDIGQEKVSLKCINEELAGQKHPDTGVLFEKKKMTIEGKQYEGVFPQFNSAFDARVPKDLLNASDVQQFKCCTQQLQKVVEQNPNMAKQFNPRQLEQIKNGEPRISGYTWHHTEHKGKIQLVNYEEHAKTHHTGGRAVWGGGADCR